MSNLSPSDIKALEQTRQRLFQLTNSLSSLQNSLANPANDPLPTWPSLHASAQIISTHLTTLSTHLAAHHGLLSSLVAYPLPSFPAQTQEGTLTTLLRKKLEPWVEEWVDAGQAKAEEVEQQTTGLKGEQLEELWEWASGVGYEDAQRRAAERARGEGDEDESDEDQDDEDRMEGIETGPTAAPASGKQKANPALTSEEQKRQEAEQKRRDDDIFRFMTRGTEPGTTPAPGAAVAALSQGGRWR